MRWCYFKIMPWLQFTWPLAPYVHHMKHPLQRQTRKYFLRNTAKQKLHTHSHTFGNKENKERELLLLTAMATLLASFLQTISGGMTDQWISKNRCYLKCTVLEKDWKQAQTLLQSKEYEYTVPCSSQKVLFAATILNKIRLQYLRLVYTCKAV